LSTSTSISGTYPLLYRIQLTPSFFVIGVAGENFHDHHFHQMPTFHETHTGFKWGLAARIHKQGKQENRTLFGRLIDEGLASFGVGSCKPKMMDLEM
jgi:hypothetical protein